MLESLPIFFFFSVFPVASVLKCTKLGRFLFSVMRSLECVLLVTNCSGYGFSGSCRDLHPPLHGANADLYVCESLLSGGGHCSGVWNGIVCPDFRLKRESNFGCSSRSKSGQKSGSRSYSYRNGILTRIHQFSLLANSEAMKMVSKLRRCNSERSPGPLWHLPELLHPSEDGGITSR